MAFNTREDRQASNALPAIPDTCGCPGCQNDAEQIRIKVSSGKGIQYRVASEVCNIASVQGKTLITMSENYQFIDWWARCNECYGKGVRNKQAKLRVEFGPSNYW